VQRSEIPRWLAVEATTSQDVFFKAFQSAIINGLMESGWQNAQLLAELRHPDLFIE